MAKITYENKEFLNKNESIADKNKVNDTDLNEIKEVVNGNDDKIGDLSDLNTTNKDSLVSAINELLPVVLYENEVGTSDNFTLSDSVANYKYIEVYVKQESYTGGYKHEKLEEPNGKKVMFNYERYETNPDRLQSFGLSVTFNGTAATVGDKFGFITGNQIYGTTAESIKVVKVLGYK